MAVTLYQVDFAATLSILCQVELASNITKAASINSVSGKPYCEFVQVEMNSTMYQIGAIINYVSHGSYSDFISGEAAISYVFDVNCSDSILGGFVINCISVGACLGFRHQLCIWWSN